MERSWMKLRHRFCREYIDGVKEFMRVAAQHAGSGSKVQCPCKKCINFYIIHLSDVKRHLFLHGIVENYNPWYLHGEQFQFADYNVATGKFQNDQNSDNQDDGRSRSSTHCYAEINDPERESRKLPEEKRESQQAMIEGVQLSQTEPEATIHELLAQPKKHTS